MISSIRGNHCHPSGCQDDKPAGRSILFLAFHRAEAEDVEGTKTSLVSNRSSLRGEDEEEEEQENPNNKKRKDKK
ncbi:hypothetical protein RUM43_002559 [Polyplax serrata]|uniref:Uncharacterized protein n=1 Tax=Polyplax serrata TaxID=468196 RepID=A0AAN8PZN2_POLSC